MQILDENRTVVNINENESLEWLTTTTANVIEGLKTGVTYILHEVSAPDGYTVAEDITFTIEVDGTVKVGETVANDNIVEMKDMPIVTVSGTKT